MGPVWVLLKGILGVRTAANTGTLRDSIPFFPTEPSKVPCLEL